jgi:hypothetical protein
LGGLIENNPIRAMSKQHILPRKKFALWLAYKGICYYCKEPVDYKDVWIDHILPEHLLKTPEKLKQILQEYELDSDFDVEDYCNLIPAHWRCNLEKGGTIFDKGAARYYINIAKGKVTTAQEEEQRVIRDLERGKLLGSLEIALSEGLLSKQALITILKLEPTPKARIEPTIITFGLNYNDLWESKLRPDWLNGYDPSDYPFVCDLLEKDLVKQLKSLLTCEFFYPEASGRNGETLSVRLSFIQLDEKEIRRFKSDWWEILELASYSDIYGEFAEYQPT